MKTWNIPVLMLSALLALPAAAEKPQVRPYAAGSLVGGIPQWNPGDKFVAIAGGSCSGNCPEYELYVFDDGRVTFVGRKNTGKTGVWKKQVDAQAYGELLTLIVRTGVLDPETRIKRGTCLKGRPVLTVMRSAPDGQSMLMQLLNSGCEGYADISRDIERLFIEWTEITPWLAPKK
ncbi:MAG TPA: DUF6438 domain-containing protein [Steroidobacteraceae bacterium]|jgi:hypothetical protein|nr:DUF6438 domain-containing protein [Steroidobacteraceae bacterium]